MSTECITDKMALKEILNPINQLRFLFTEIKKGAKKINEWTKLTKRITKTAKFAKNLAQNLLSFAEAGPLGQVNASFSLLASILTPFQPILRVIGALFKILAFSILKPLMPIIKPMLDILMQFAPILQKLGEIIAVFLRPILEGLAWVVENVIYPAVKWVVDGLEYIIKNLLYAVKWFVNLLIGFLNLVIDAINWVTKYILFGWLWGFKNIPHIPTLAEGGFVPATPGGQLVVIGEGGQGEHVIPEEQFNEAFNQVNSNTQMTNIILMRMYRQQQIDRRRR